MSKLQIALILICFHFTTAEAQNLSAHDCKLYNKMEILSNKIKNRKITTKDKILFDSRTQKTINADNLSKELLRKHFASNDMNDYNFEFFRLKIKNTEELNEKIIQRNYSKLFSLLENESYNKLTYSYSIKNSEIIIDIVLSENVIKLDDEKEICIIQGAGFQSEKITYKGTSRINDIVFMETDDYFKTIDSKNGKRLPLKLNSQKRFEITIDVSSHTPKYVCIENTDGKKLSIVRIY